MQTAIAHDVSRRRGLYKATTYAGRLSVVCLAAADSSTEIQWPSDRYRKNPVAFCKEVLGVKPWEKQVEILEAVRDHKRVAVRSGHKVSKSHSAAILALWFFCSFEDARVVLTSTTSRQVDTILWREIKKLVAKAKKPINLEPPHELARSGLKAPDFREVVGFTAKDPEAVAGVSGANLLYLADEASGIPNAIFEAMEGNRAGGASVAMFSNPTRTEGEFFEAFHEKARFYKTIHISSEESPNVKAGREIIPGLASRAWVDEKREEWGEESALYKVRVKGEFVQHEQGKIFSLHTLGESEERWEEADATGRLFIGLDPAGAGDRGDESAFSARRGLKQLELRAMHGKPPGDLLATILDLIHVHGVPREKPVVVVDAEGQIGADVVRVFREYLATHEDAFELVIVRVSQPAQRQPNIYLSVRDEVLANLADWVRDGGAILADVKLAKDLHAPAWHAAAESGPRHRLTKATDKKEIRKALGRSPDRGDATALSVWEPRSLSADAPEVAPVASRVERDEPEEHAETTFDPYGGLRVWGS